jgi:hypothetical protein
MFLAWRFCQLAHWQSLVALFQPVCWRSDENPSPLWTVALNNFSVSLCGVQVWMITWLFPSSSKVVLDERCICDFCRINYPNVWWKYFWISNVVRTSIMDVLLIFHVKWEISWRIILLGDESDVAVPYLTSQVLNFKSTGLFCIGMDENVYRLNAQTRDPLFCRRILYVAYLIRKISGYCNTQIRILPFKTELQCALDQWWHFRKPAWSTGQI